MYTIGRSYIILFLIFILFVSLRANINNFIPDYEGEIEYRVDTLFSMPESLFDQGYTGRYYNFEFTTDVFGNIYLYQGETTKIRKITNKKITISRVLDSTIITMSYYNGKVWIFDGSRVISYDTSGLRVVDSIYLEPYRNNPLRVMGISRIVDRFLLIGDFFVYKKGGKDLFTEDRIEYIFDLETKKLSSHIPVNNERYYNIFVNCNRCSVKELYELFFVKTSYYAETLSVDYLTESKDYIFFRVRPPIIDLLFSDRKLLEQERYLIYDKSHKATYLLSGIEKYHFPMGRHPLALFRFTYTNDIMFINSNNNKKKNHLLNFLIIRFDKEAIKNKEKIK